MRAFTLSRPGRLLAILACAPGILAAAFVLATLVLLAVDGHPGGLLAAGAGTAVPVVLWGAWRLIQSPAGSLVSDTEPQGSDDQEVTARAELEVTLEDTSPLVLPTRTISVRLG